MIKVVNKLIREQDKVVKRFLLLSLIQISGEATVEILNELAIIRKELYKVIQNERQ